MTRSKHLTLAIAAAAALAAALAAAAGADATEVVAGWKNLALTAGWRH